ncbi:MAG: dihydropteroate synthase [Nitriliruptoraceae bacterium]|nr:dihydropteroate synthase [Nitriliruptoraceae bacterium]
MLAATPTPDPTATVTLPAAAHTFVLRPGAPAVMGIVNTNPGSFSDTRHLATTEEQFATAMRMVEAGAAIIDVGTDSGVTHGDSIDLDVQITRAVPLVEKLVAQGVPVSIDTPFAPVAEATLAAGAAMINDVSGLADPRIAELCAAHDAALVILHTRVEHKKEAFLDFDDVVADVEELFVERIERAVSLGLARERIVLDPGIGYAKYPHDDVEVIRAYPRFAALGLSFLTGASRKYFTGVITGAEPPERLPETLATVEAVRAFPGFVRVHDVPEVGRYLAVMETLDGLRAFPEYDTSVARLKWLVADPDDAADADDAEEPAAL